MVKRVATPPPASGEPLILCITNPYPERGDWDFDTDASGSEVLLGQWLASFIDIDSIFAIHWRPKDDVIMVSVEKKDGKAYDDILGEHRWGEFQRECAKADRKKTSRIYKATFLSEREMQRLGWREKVIEPSWFEEDQSHRFVRPYPAPHYTEAAAQYGRPLPVPKELQPPPQPVVGTAKWVTQAAVPKIKTPAVVPEIVVPEPAAVPATVDTETFWPSLANTSSKMPKPLTPAPSSSEPEWITATTKKNRNRKKKRDAAA